MPLPYLFVCIFLSLTIRVQGRPPNDNFSQRITLSGVEADFSADNSLATTEAREPIHPAPAAGHTLWWTWTAPAEGWLHFENNFPSVEVVHAVYVGSALSYLVQAPQIVERWRDNMYVLHTNTKPIWRVRPGVAYPIVVSASTNNSYLPLGEMASTLVFEAAPPNDNFPGLGLTQLPISIRTGNNGASTQPGEPVLTETGLGASLWWSWQPPGRGRLNIRPAHYWQTVGVYTGSMVNQLFRLDGGGSFFSVPVDAGQIYRIAADGRLGHAINLEFGVDFERSPDNDDFSSRIPISGTQVTVGGRNHGATAESGESISFASVSATVWYSWVAPVDGWTHLQLESTNGRAIAFVYTGNAVSNLALIAKTDALDSYNHRTKTAFQARSGVEYLIAVDTWEGADEPTFADFKLSLDETTLRILSPENGTSLPGKELPTLTVNTPIESVDGVLQRVEYRYGNERCNDCWRFGVTTNPPFTFTPASLSSDRWTVTAHALNSLGQLRISSPITFTVRPLNDNFTNSVELTGYRVGNNNYPFGLPWFDGSSGSTRFATAEPDEPEHGGSPPVATVWYSWTAPASGVAEFDYQFQATGSVARVYTGNRLNQLQPVNLNHTFGSRFDTFETGAGITYHFVFSAERTDLESYHAGFGFSLNLPTLQLAFPTNGLSLGELADVPLGVTTIEPPSHVSRIEYIANYGVIATSTVPPYDAVWRGVSAGRYQISARAITVEGFQVRTPAVTILIRPSNDHFSNRLDLVGRRVTARAYLASATRELGEPGWGDQSAWWSWTALQSGTVWFEVKGENEYANAKVTVFRGEAIDSLTPVDSTDPVFPYSWTPYRPGEFKAIAGETYSIRVVNGEDRHITVNLRAVQPALNDLFKNRIRLSGTPLEFIADTCAATTELNEPRAFDGYAGRHTVWFSWTAPANGTVRLIRRVNSPTGGVAAFRGASLTNLQQVATGRSEMLFAAQGGETYQILIDDTGAYPDKVPLRLDFIPSGESIHPRVKRVTLDPIYLNSLTLEVVGLPDQVFNVERSFDLKQWSVVWPGNPFQLSGTNKIISMSLPERPPQYFVRVTPQ